MQKHFRHPSGFLWLRWKVPLVHSLHRRPMTLGWKKETALEQHEQGRQSPQHPPTHMHTEGVAHGGHKLRWLLERKARHFHGGQTYRLQLATAARWNLHVQRQSSPICQKQTMLGGGEGHQSFSEASLLEVGCFGDRRLD